MLLAEQHSQDGQLWHNTHSFENSKFHVAVEKNGNADLGFNFAWDSNILQAIILCRQQRDKSEIQIGKGNSIYSSLDAHSKIELEFSSLKCTNYLYEQFIVSVYQYHHSPDFLLCLGCVRWWIRSDDYWKCWVIKSRNVYHGWILGKNFSGNKKALVFSKFLIELGPHSESLATRIIYSTKYKNIIHIS